MPFLPPLIFRLIYYLPRLAKAAPQLSVRNAGHTVA